MAQICFNIDDAKLASFVDIMCKIGGGYQATLDNGQPNPLTKAQFAKQTLITVIQGLVRNQIADNLSTNINSQIKAELDAHNIS